MSDPDAQPTGDASNEEIAAFFDLDRTLIDVNSGLVWAKHEQSEGNISMWQLARASFWTLLYHVSLIDMEKAFAEAVRHYEGETWEALEERTREWFYEDIEHRLRDGARESLDAHRDSDHHLVLLTDSSCFEAAAAAEAWELDDWLANEFETDDDGRLTGAFHTPLCYGEGKVTRAEAWAAKRGVDLSHSYFYSDSYSDVPMLEAVGHPRIVDPDPRLRRHARSQDWPIEDW
jgi:HAD superfamily hydrolase (TIGR01490 family)